jgi:hypothetical protein
MPNPSKELLKATTTGAPRLAFSVAEFCALIDISISMYGKMRREGLTPRELRFGRRVLITPESIEQWRREREAASA